MTADLSDIDDLRIDPGPDGDHAALSWRRASTWTTLTHAPDEPERIWDAEDALGVLLGMRAPLPLIRRALAGAYPTFDLDAWFEHQTMPDRAAWRAADRQRRADLIREFRERRGT